MYCVLYNIYLAAVTCWVAMVGWITWGRDIGPGTGGWGSGSACPSNSVGAELLQLLGKFNIIPRRCMERNEFWNSTLTTSQLWNNFSNCPINFSNVPGPLGRDEGTGPLLIGIPILALWINMRPKVGVVALLERVPPLKIYLLLRLNRKFEQKGWQIFLL